MQLLLESALNHFEAHLRHELRLSENTVSAYLTDLRQLKDYLLEQYTLEDAASIKTLHLRSWFSALKNKGIANRSIRRKAATLNSFFRFFMMEGTLPSNPARKLILPKSDKPLPAFLNPQQAKRLSTQTIYPDTYDGATEQLIMELLYQTGMRRSELIQLKEQDIRFSRKEIRILGKGGKMRLIPLHDNMLERLKKYLELKKERFDFVTKNVLSLKSGKPLYPQYVYRVVKKYLSTVTTLKKRSPHVMRHTFASLLLNNGADLVAIKSLLGHQSLAATQIYTHMDINRLKKVYQQAHPKS